MGAGFALATQNTLCLPSVCEDTCIFRGSVEALLSYTPPLSYRPFWAACLTHSGFMKPQLTGRATTRVQTLPCCHGQLQLLWPLTSSGRLFSP